MAYKKIKGWSGLLSSLTQSLELPEGNLQKINDQSVTGSGKKSVKPGGAGK